MEGHRAHHLAAECGAGHPDDRAGGPQGCNSAHAPDFTAGQERRASWPIMHLSVRLCLEPCKMQDLTDITSCGCRGRSGCRCWETDKDRGVPGRWRRQGCGSGGDLPCDCGEDQDGVHQQRCQLHRASFSPSSHILAVHGIPDVAGYYAATSARRRPLRVLSSAASRTGAGHWQGTLHALGTIMRTEGLAGLFRGIGPTIVTNAPYSAFYYLLYTSLQQRMQQVERCLENAPLPAMAPSCSLKASSH